jgi:hypothetical protein
VVTVKFTGPFITEDLPGGEDVWKIVVSYAFIDQDGRWYIVPAGTITDGASIPKGLWIVAGHPRETDIGQAAGVHDIDYRLGNGTRKECDQRLIRGMKVLGASWWKRQAVYAGIRLGGQVAWDGYRKSRGTK